jgi:hypothetical protein
MAEEAAMVGSWVVASVIRFSSNGEAVMTRLSSSAKMANTTFQRQQGQITANEAAMRRYQTRMAAVRAEQIRLMQSTAALGAVIMGALVVTGVSDAAKLEKAMTGVAIATGTAADKYGDLRKAQLAQVMNVSGTTAQSNVTIANEMAMAARSGLNDPKKLQGAFKQIAMLADVQWMAQGQNPVETVKLATQFAHFFNAYSGKPLQNMLDDVNRLMFMMPEKMQNLVTQGKYFIPNAISLGIDEKTIMAQLAIMGTTGFLQSKGGTSLNNLILRALGSAALNNHLTAKKMEGGNTLGLLNAQHQLKAEFLKKGGGLDLDALMKQVSTMRVAMQLADPTRGISNWQNAVGFFFGAEAQRLVNVEANPDVRKRITENKKTMSKIGGVKETWEKYNKDVFLAASKVKTNFSNILTTIFLPTLPTLTKFFNGLADSLSRVSDFLSAHPTIAKTLGFGAMAATGVLAGGAAMGSMGFIGRVIGGAGGGGILRALGGAGGSLLSMLTLPHLRGALAGGAGRAGGVLAHMGEWFFGKVGGGKRGMGRTMFGGAHPSWNLASVFEDIPKKMAGAGEWLFGKVGGGKRGMGKTMFGGAHPSWNLTAVFEDAWKAIRPFIGRIGLLGEVFAKVGLRFVPFIGELMLFWDALKFLLTTFEQHPKEIGKWVGMVIGYIRFTLFPSIMNSFVTWGPKIVAAFEGMLGGMWQAITHPRFTLFPSIMNSFVTWGPKIVAAFEGMLGGMWQAITHPNWGGLVSAYHDFMAAQHAEQNQQQYLANQRNKAASPGSHVLIQNAHFPGVRNTSDLLHDLDPFRLTQGQADQRTAPGLPLPHATRFSFGH